MELITREVFLAWAEKNNWLMVNDAASAEGRQLTFITSTGAVTFVIFDLKGNLHTVAQPLAQVPQGPQQTSRYPYPLKGFQG